MPDELANKPEPSREAIRIWELYVKLKGGCERITYTEMQAYGVLTGEVLTPIEAEAMIKIDQARLSSG
jgi:hypothetical protein